MSGYVYPFLGEIRVHSSMLGWNQGTFIHFRVKPGYVYQFSGETRVCLSIFGWNQGTFIHAWVKPGYVYPCLGKPGYVYPYLGKIRVRLSIFGWNQGTFIHAWVTGACKGRSGFFADQNQIFVSTCSQRLGLSEKLNIKIGGPALFWARTRFLEF